MKYLFAVPVFVAAVILFATIAAFLFWAVVIGLLQ
jgi:hypothetical protein